MPQNPNQVDPDWPFRGIDHALVRCGDSGPSLLIRGCRRAFDQPATAVSDRYGVVVDLEVPARALPHAAGGGGPDRLVHLGAEQPDVVWPPDRVHGVGEQHSRRVRGR